ncbi:MAG: DUF177 domain-containing protein [Deltaproteobacteria bacterium]|nr:DUF177 domain-containing protein [Deltaproteobacteria bacterium]
MDVKKKRFGRDNAENSLVIRLKDLSVNEAEYRGTFLNAWLVTELGQAPVKPKPGAELAVILRASKQETTVLISGEMTTDLVATCSRCLSDYPFPVKSELSFVLIPKSDLLLAKKKVDETDGAVVETEASQEDTYTGGSIDPTPLIREQLLLLLPEYPVCRPDCKGLCAGCGRDLNSDACVCAPKNFDSPFAALKKLKLN